MTPVSKSNSGNPINIEAQSTPNDDPMANEQRDDEAITTIQLLREENENSRHEVLGRQEAMGIIPSVIQSRDKTSGNESHNGESSLFDGIFGVTSDQLVGKHELKSVCAIRCSVCKHELD